MLRWRSVWGQAHTDISECSAQYADATARLALRMPVGGTALRLRLSNREGTAPLRLSGARAYLAGGGGGAVLFGGGEGVCLSPGAETRSDALPLPVDAGELLLIEMAFSGPVGSGGFISEHLRCAPGDRLGGGRFPACAGDPGFYDLGMPIPALASVELETASPAPGVVCFGDSITQMSRWTRPLSLRLTGRAAVLNKGIGGNCLLTDPPADRPRAFGRSGLARFDRDALDEPGAELLILSIGTNDLGWAYDAARGAAALERAFALLAERARERGLRVLAATIPPRGGSGDFDAEREQERRRFNGFVRAAEGFDAVLDFDEALRDPRDASAMAFAWDGGDHLHPGILGGERMAERALAALEPFLP